MELTIGELLGSGAVATILGLTLIQIAPIKINPWSALARAIGRAVNGELINEVSNMKHELIDIRNDLGEKAAKDGRVRILRFGDELLHDVKHSKEHFDQILLDITEYEQYCEAHPEFKNNMTAMTTQHIKHTYEKCVEEHSFL